MTSLSRLSAVARFVIPLSAFAALCAGGVVGHSVTKDLGDNVLTSADGSPTATPNRFDLAERDGGGPEVVRSNA
jgi:hypothetical protein